MSRLFDDSASDYLLTASTPITAAPISMAAWVYWDNVDANDSVISIADASAGAEFFDVQLRGAGTNQLRFTTSTAAGASSADGGTLTINTWHHIAAVSNAANHRIAYLDATAGSAETTERIPANLDRIGIGCRADSSPDQFLSGRVFWPAIWNVALNQGHIDLLASGVHPYRVARESLVFFAPLWWDEDYDVVGTLDLNPELAITNAEVTTGTATLTVSDSTLVEGNTVRVAGVTPDDYNGEYTCLANSDATSIKYTLVEPGDGSAYGTATKVLATAGNPPGLVHAFPRSRRTGRLRQRVA